jgi:hypothetical protein
MKPKALLIYIVPVLLLLSTIYGYNIQDQPGTDLKSSNEYRESVLGNPPVMPFAIGDSCGGTGQEKHDDGSFENGGGWNNTVTDGRFVLKFRPPSYPWKYTKFCIALTRLATGSDSLKFDVVLFDSTGAGGLPGAQIGSLPNQTARPVLFFPHSHGSLLISPQFRLQPLTAVPFISESNSMLQLHLRQTSL